SATSWAHPDGRSGPSAASRGSAASPTCPRWTVSHRRPSTERALSARAARVVPLDGGPVGRTQLVPLSPWTGLQWPGSPPTRSLSPASTAVVPREIGGGELARAAVALDVGGRALGGRTVAAGAGRLDDHQLVGGELHAPGLRRQLRAAAVRGLQQEAAARAGRAAEDPPRRVPEALAHPVELADVADRAHAAPQPHAAAEAA